MDILTLAALFCLALGGVALDAYQHPRTLDVAIVDRGNDTGTALDKGLVTGVVSHELDRMARVPSLLARPHIRPSEEKGFVEALGDATGTTAVLNVVASTVQDSPDALNLGVYAEGGKLKAYVFGSASAVPSRDGRFDLIVTQEDGETTVDTVKRATVAGAARIDPYLAMLYQLSELERTGQERYAANALVLAEYAERRIPATASMVLLARMQNIEGLVQLRLGKLDLASAAFASGLGHVPPGDVGPTPVILRLNKAFVDVARDDIADATALIAQVSASTDNFQNLVGLKVSTSEDIQIRLHRDQVDLLRSASDTISAAIALRRKNVDAAEVLLKRALQADPHQLGAISMLADIQAMRGNQAAERALRDSVVEQSLANNPYLEVALVHATLSFAGDTVTLKPSQNVTR